jgi:LmbE family N-acetylglucosaminyl deacetylase
MEIQNLLSPPDLMEYQSVLCIQPHPDDNEIGAGAVIAKLASKGCKITYLTITNGNLGSNDPKLTKETIAAIRTKETKLAGKHLGVTDFRFLNYDDGSLESVKELARDICGVIREVRPQAILCPDPWLTYEAHSDHRITGLAASKAALDCSLTHYETKYLEPPCQIEAVGYYYTSRPNTVFDVTDHLQTKFEAIALHESQMGGGVYELYHTYFTMKATELASGKGFQAGEGLKVLRPLHLHCFLDADRI